jgi:hypothetical protein
MNLNELPGPPPTFFDHVRSWIQSNRVSFITGVTVVLVLLAGGLQLLEWQRQRVHDLTRPLIQVGDHFTIEAHYDSAVAAKDISEISIECVGSPPAGSNNRFDFQVVMTTTDTGGMDTAFSSEAHQIDPLISCKAVKIPFFARDPDHSSGYIAFDVSGTWNGAKLKPIVLRTKLLQATVVSYIISVILVMVAALTKMFGSKLIDKFLGTETS